MEEHKKPEKMAPVGRKFDMGKTRWGLMPSLCLEKIAEVFTYGAAKYGDNNWKDVEKSRYVDALFRHLHAWMQGEREDKESGLHHLAHAGANILFLLWKEKWGDANKPNVRMENGYSIGDEEDGRL